VQHFEPEPRKNTVQNSRVVKNKIEAAKFENYTYFLLKQEKRDLNP
jgi:hypothetical protein